MTPKIEYRNLGIRKKIYEEFEAIREKESTDFGYIVTQTILLAKMIKTYKDSLNK